jgi:hypothetical protein
MSKQSSLVARFSPKATLKRVASSLRKSKYLDGALCGQLGALWVFRLTAESELFEKPEVVLQKFGSHLSQHVPGIH